MISCQRRMVGDLILYRQYLCYYYAITYPFCLKVAPIAFNILTVFLGGCVSLLRMLLHLVFLLVFIVNCTIIDR